MTAKTIRVPARVYFFITGTGWFQGQSNAHVMSTADNPRPLTPDEIAGDQQDAELIDLIHKARKNSDGSLTLPATPWVVAQMWKEGDYLKDTYLYGDHDPDTLADYNAGLAMMRRAAQALGKPSLFRQDVDQVLDADIERRVRELK